jgi:hypothetical protein
MPTMDTEQLAQEFINRTLPKSAWTHQAHLRVGLWHARRYSPREALDLLRERIRGYNESVGGENTPTAGYHETITRFYLAIIGQFVASVDLRRSTEELEQELIKRFGDKELPLRYFTRERLHSTEARLGWLEPDLLPLVGADGDGV